MGLLLLMGDNGFNPAKLVAGKLGAYYDFRPETSVDIVQLRRSSDDATADFSWAELADGTAATWVGNGNVGYLATLYDLSGNAEHLSQASSAAQPVVISSTGLFTYEADFDTGDFISMNAKTRNLSAFTLTAVFNNQNETAQNNIAITLAGASTFRLLIANNLGSTDWTFSQVGSGTTTGSFGVNKLGVYGSKNVLTVGIESGKLFFYLNDSARTEFTLGSVAGSTSIDLDFGGRAGGTLNGFLSAFLQLFNENLTASQIGRLHKYFLAKFEVKEPTLASGYPLTVVEDTAVDASSLANTGLSYDPVEDEIVISQWNSTGSYNAILRYDRQTMTLNATVPIDEAIQPGIQEVFAINGVYYVGGGTETMQKFDSSGNHLGSAVLPVTPGWKNAVNYSLGYIWAINANGLYKIDPATLGVVETFANRFTGNEGLFVTSAGVLRGGTGFIRYYSWRGETLLEILGDEGEGTCIDPDGSIYVNRDEYFHGGTPDGNRLWKYEVREVR